MIGVKNLEIRAYTTYTLQVRHRSRLHGWSRSRAVVTASVAGGGAVMLSYGTMGLSAVVGIAALATVANAALIELNPSASCRDPAVLFLRCVLQSVARADPIAPGPAQPTRSTTMRSSGY